jgi:hypothetical protein
VYDTNEWRAQEQHDPNIDPEFIQLCGEKTKLYGLSIAEYMSRLDEFEGYQQIAYIYWHGAPLVKPEFVKDLPTKMRRLHKWYMEAYAESKNWIYAGYKHHHYGHGDSFLLIVFLELFQFYQQDALDKTIVSAYCL